MIKTCSPGTEITFCLISQVPSWNLTHGFQCHVVKSASMKLKLGSIINLMIKNKQRKKVSPSLWYDLRNLKPHASTLVSGFHHELSFTICVEMRVHAWMSKWAFMKLKLCSVIDLMLIKNREKVSPCLWCGLRHPKFYVSTLVSGFHHEPG